MNVRSYDQISHVTYKMMHTSKVLWRMYEIATIYQLRIHKFPERRMVISSYLGRINIIR